MKRLVLAAITALLLAGGFAFSGAQPASAYTYAAYSNCAQSSGYGTRLCYDRGDRYIYIYTGAVGDTGVDLQFPTNGYGTGYYYTGPVGVYAPTESIHVNYEQVNLEGSDGSLALFLRRAIYDQANLIPVWGGNFDYIIWFAASAGYEFVVTAS